MPYKNKYRYISYFISSLIVSACTLSGKSTDKIETLRSVDITSNNIEEQKVFIAPKSEAEIRAAYSDYLRFAGKNDNARSNAINRLAEMEFELSNKLLEENKNLEQENSDSLDDKLYTQRLESTINLLSTSLKDYPNLKNNDRLLYQLAKAQEQAGKNQASQATLETLVTRYPESKYTTEAYFRIAEDAFSLQDYITAEDAYTQVIGSPKSEIFYEKSLFKRGWSRFKQQFYYEAVDDFLEAVNYHEFDTIEKLKSSEKDQFDEYFRAIGLSFSYLGGSEPLREYFQQNPDFRYIYYTYAMISDIYLKQERYTDAADTMQQFISQHKDSNRVPYSYLKIAQIWQKSSFTKQLHQSIESLYTKFNPDNIYWKTTNQDSNINKAVTRSLRQYVSLMAGYYHNAYQKQPNTNLAQNAETWYKRYLKHYPAYVRQEKTHFLYAELLNQTKQYAKSLYHYELAAYDGDLILNKEAAYATIVLTDQINKTARNDKQWLNKHITYALRFSQEYRNDKRSSNVITYAAELAYRAKQYQRAIELTSINSVNSINNQLIRAQSYFSLQQYPQAETSYADLLLEKSLAAKQKQTAYDGLALSIYKQAEQDQKNGQLKSAQDNFIRIVDVAAPSDIAATGLYDGISLAITQKQWPNAINAIQRFQKQYPAHKRYNDVNKKLTVAYLESGQNSKAAQQFELISTQEKDQSLKKNALWQAASLYEKQNNTPAAIRAYSDYAKQYTRPYPEYMEAMYKVSQLTKSPASQSEWLNAIIQADKKAYKKVKTPRTKLITSKAAVNLATYKEQEYQRYELKHPLKTNLRKKKEAMQAAVKLYGQASVYKIAETTTQATHAIANIYNDFSQALLESERPKGLNEDELEQYEILLEDQAYPFEDKAIEFYEANINRIKDGTYNQWITASLSELKTLFPTRYARPAKIEPFIKSIN